MRAASTLALLVSALALVAAGCGGGDDEEASSTDQWAEDFCGAITTWHAALTDATDELRGLSISRDSLEQAADDMRSATTDFVDDLQALGAPETTSGEEAKQAIDDFETSLEEGRADIEAAVDDVSGITGVPKAIQDITAALSSIDAARSKMLAAIRTEDAQDELQSAFENADACDDLG